MAAQSPGVHRNKRSSHYLRVKRSSWQLQRQQNKLSGCKIYLKISRKESQKKAVIRIDKKSAIALTKNPVFHGRSKHIRSRFHFIRECVEDGLVTVEHVVGIRQTSDMLTKPLGRIKLKEMRSLVGIQDVSNDVLKIKGGRMLT